MDKTTAKLIRKKPFPVFKVSSELESIAESNVDIVLDTLKQDSLYRPDLIYRGATVDDYRVILKAGTDRADPNFDYLIDSSQMELNIYLKNAGFNPSDYFFGAPESQLGDSYSDDPLDYALYQDNKTPVLLIYNPDQLIDKGNYELDMYLFKNPQKKLEAVVAMFIWDINYNYCFD